MVLWMRSDAESTTVPTMTREMKRQQWRRECVHSPLRVNDWANFKLANGDV
jgi:hypothetical protein